MGGSGHFVRLAQIALALAATGMFSVAEADGAGLWVLDAAGRAQVDVSYDCTKSAPTAGLSAAGLTIATAVQLPPLCVVEGWAAPADLARISAVAGVTAVKRPTYVSPRHPLAPGNIGVAPAFPLRSQKAQGASGIDANGISIMHADTFVAQTQTSGSGVLVGVQSTGVTSLAAIQGRGELPGNVQLFYPSGQSSPPVGDEGTALMEEIHAAAPGAGLAFCGPNTFVEYTSCLGQLITAGATVLVDDIIFPGEDVMSSNSSNAQAIGQLLAQNPAVVMFTSAGNYTGSYWEGPYTPVQSPATLTCTFNGVTQTDNYVASFGATPYETLTVTSDSQFPFTFAWADPPGQNASNFELYWYQNGAQLGCASAAGSSQPMIVPQSQSGLPYLALPAGTYQLYVATPDASLANKYLKLWAGGDGVTTLSASTPGAIASTQALAPGVSTIGAVDGSQGIGDTIEYFSSVGPLYVAFPTPAHIQAPALVAPDGISVDAAGTYFQDFLFPDGNFYGTSAAVPNAGAVAALLRGAFPDLSAADVLKALENGATPLGGGSPNATYGYGRVDALGALQTFPAPTLTSLPDSTLDPGKTTAAYPITVSGFGPLHFTVTSSNTSLIPASLVVAGSAGVTIAPSSCGSTTLTCTVTVTAASGQYGGAVSMTLSAVDGANRAAPAAMMVTVNGPPAPPPPPPPPTVTVSSSSGSGGGGVLQWWEIVSLALVAFTGRGRRLEKANGRRERAHA
jgi:hypothetical protein